MIHHIHHLTNGRMVNVGMVEQIGNGDEAAFQSTSKSGQVSEWFADQREAVQWLHDEDTRTMTEACTNCGVALTEANECLFTPGLCVNCDMESAVNTWALQHENDEPTPCAICDDVNASRYNTPDGAKTLCRSCAMTLYPELFKPSAYDVYLFSA